MATDGSKSMGPKMPVSKRYVTSVSFDMGLMEVNEERLKVAAAQIFRGRLAKKGADVILNEEKEKKEQEEDLDGLEPDWSAFESAYAADLYPKDDGYYKTAQFLTEVVDLLIDYVRKMNNRSTKVLDFHHPHQLKEALGHCLEIPETPRDLEQILSDCKETLKYNVKTGHPRFFNQLSSGLDIIALAGEWLTATANTNMFTYEIAPVFTLMEEVTLQRMRELVGWEEGDGIFAPGGAISNLYAVMAARYKKFPDLKMAGMSGGPAIALFTSEHAHYSIKQAAAVTGIGVNNVFLIKTSPGGKMLIEDLEAKIEEAKTRGLQPLLVSATAGTTVLGAFDPLEEIAAVCSEHGLWMHVDAAWGGGVLVSRRHCHLARGIAKADSVTWNPHKAMGVTLQCSAVLLRETGLLAGCNSMNATYLFQQDKQYDMNYDTGDKAIQCGRHNDVFKLWLMWRAKGDEGFEKQIDRLFELSGYLQDQIVKREGFEFVMDKPEYLNVCFWYVPLKYRNVTEPEERNKIIDEVAPKIKAMMMEAGTTMVGYQPLGIFPNFFRMIVSNPAATREDIDFMLNEIQRFGEEV